MYLQKHWLNSLFEIMNNGDMLIFTTLSGMGLDIQLLKENSKSVSPPHHLNFLNPKSVSNMLTEVGFSVLEITTPGKLDIDIVRNFTRENNLKIKIPDFLQSVIEDENLSKSFSISFVDFVPKSCNVEIIPF